MKKQGVLIYDDVIGRMDIRFGPLDYYGGLHCGERLEVLLDGEWIPTRIELGEFWYLKGVKLIKLNGQCRYEPQSLAVHHGPCEHHHDIRLLRPCVL